MATPEGKFKTKVVKWLRSKGCFVWICKQDSTTQKGVSDLFFCYRTKYGFLELKRSADAPFRVGQREFLDLYREWVVAEAVYPENFPAIQHKIEEYLLDA